VNTPGEKSSGSRTRSFRKKTRSSGKRTGASGTKNRIHEIRKDLRSLPDGQIIGQLKKISSKERELQATILLYLAEIERRRLYLPLGYGSLFDFCTSSLGYTRATAARRIASAKAAARFPVALDLLRSGEINITNLSIASRMTVRPVCVMRLASEGEGCEGTSMRNGSDSAAKCGSQRYRCEGGATGSADRPDSTLSAGTKHRPHSTPSAGTADRLHSTPGAGRLQERRILEPGLETCHRDCPRPGLRVRRGAVRLYRARRKKMRLDLGPRDRPHRPQGLGRRRLAG